ncbi:tail fiber domain-containing protein [Lacinutrix iliipiscaria]|uniref:Tail fiber domain-containing protein n=1 Tax=Lacinutrix iliipiscaria TaxID=1230532 RepID=A0ABW5WM65_9FLAO
MKPLKLILIAICLFSIQLNFAQVGIGNTDPKSTLDISASNTTSPADTDGILIPRMSNFPSTPSIDQDGMLIFYTGTAMSGKGFYYWDDTTTNWVFLTSGGKNTLDQAYDQGGAGIGKNITADNGAVRINGTDGFLVTGTSGSGNIIDTEITGSGTRMFFSPIKGAFRAGQIDNNEWDDSNIGVNSFAAGNSTTASGDYSTSLGFYSQATAIYSTAIGFSANAIGSNSTAIGTGIEASGDYSFATGYFTDATGTYSTALGYETLASGNRATAMGYQTIASGHSSTAIGNNTNATSSSSIAIGESTTASGSNSLALGYLTTASNSFSTAMGRASLASGYASTAMGYGTDATGQYSTSMGEYTIASGNHSTAMGRATEASGSFSTSMGESTVASGNNSMAIGESTVASGNNSMAIGESTVSPSYAETSIGYYNISYTPNSNSSANSSDRVFSIGNGNNLSRSNALTIYKSGLMNINDEYDMPLTDGTANQIMTTDGTGHVSFVDATSLFQSEWSDTGSSIHPSDGIAKEVTIGTLTAGTGKLTINANDMDTGLDIDKSGNFSNPNYAIDNYINNEDDGDSYGIKNVLEGSLGGNNRFGVYNEINGVSSSPTILSHYGVKNLISSSGSGHRYGTFNEITSAGSGSRKGTENVLSGLGNGWQYGVSNTLAGSSGGHQFGVFNEFTNFGNGQKTGVYNDMTFNALGIRYGVRSDINGTGNSDHYGIYNDLSGSGTGDKYGSYNVIDVSAGGTHYGVYSNAQNSNGYAAYFIGNTSLGASTTNRYVMPETDGTANQVMTTNGAGIVTFNTLNEESSTASNGLTANTNDIQLGGTLTQNTNIDYGNFDTRFNLNGSGDFIIQDTGSGVFTVNDAGNSIVGRNMTWRENSIVGTIIGQMLTDGTDDGRFTVRENGNISVDLRANTAFIFNEQGLDRDFRVESDNQQNMLLVDAANDLVGIGGLPNANLHVFHGSNAGGDGFKIENTGANNRDWRMYVYNGSGDLGLFNALNGNTVVGNFNDASGVYSATSDRRLKRDFKPLPFSWENFMKLETLSYLYKRQKDDKRNLGLIAQDVELIYPELVTHNKEGDVYHMNYSGFGVVAIKAVQELKDEVDVLKEENKKLKAQLSKYEALEARLNALESKNTEPQLDN